MTTTAALTLLIMTCQIAKKTRVTQTRVSKKSRFNDTELISSPVVMTSLPYGKYTSSAVFAICSISTTKMKYDHLSKPVNVKQRKYTLVATCTALLSSTSSLIHLLIYLLEPFIGCSRPTNSCSEPWKTVRLAILPKKTCK